MDLYGKDKGNISLSPRLQPPDFDEEKLENVIVNTQKCFYDLKIAEINKRIQRFEDRNQELENILKNIDYSIKFFEEEKKKEISGLNSQVIYQSARVEDCKKQLTTLEKSRIDDESAHNMKIININEKYKNTRLVLTSQIKILSAKTNILEDYKSTQQILEKKLDAQNKALIRDKEQVAESLHQIECKFRMDKEKLKNELHNRLFESAVEFQLQVNKHLPHCLSKLLSENIAVSTILSTIAKTITLRKQDSIRYKYTVKEHNRKIKDAHLNTKQSIVVQKLEKSVIAILCEILRKANVNVFKFDKPIFLTEEQYITNIDKVKNKARICEVYVKNLKILLYCEKQKFDIAENQKQWISDQVQTCLEMFYDIKYVLMNLKENN